MSMKDIQQKAYDEYNKLTPDKPDLITKIASWVAGVLVLSFVVWHYAIPIFGIAGVIVDWVSATMDFLLSWKTMLLFLLVFIAIVLNEIRLTLISILNKMYD